VCVRRSTPEVGFASVEVTLPWLVSALAGVNAAGVCVAISPMRGWPHEPGPAAPTHLLVQECLQRFEDVDGCIDWCLKRPVLGDATLVLADARGQTATVDVRGRTRTVALREKGPLAADASGPIAAPGADAAERGLGVGEGGLVVALDAERRVLDLRGLGRMGDAAERITLEV